MRRRRIFIFCCIAGLLLANVLVSPPAEDIGASNVVGVIAGFFAMAGFMFVVGRSPEYSDVPGFLWWQAVATLLLWGGMIISLVAFIVAIVFS